MSILPNWRPFDVEWRKNEWKKSWKLAEQIRKTIFNGFFRSKWSVSQYNLCDKSNHYMLNLPEFFAFISFELNDLCSSQQMSTINQTKIKRMTSIGKYRGFFFFFLISISFSVPVMGTLLSIAIEYFNSSIHFDVWCVAYYWLRI